MATEAYDSCPCGSGKKFKWCCQPIHVPIDRAFQLEEEGQHDAALRTLDQVIAANPSNPEPLGRKAQLLFNQGKPEEAEELLHKAFALNPRYAFGHLLQGLFRRSEGEIPGALLLFRKAAEYYDPEAKNMLGQLYELIAECELKMNRPVAARAAVQIVLRCQPSDDQTAQAFETVFGKQSRLPLSARREYTLQSPPADAPAGRRAAWDRPLALGRSPRLSELAGAFEQLTAEDAEDAAAWYNLGVARAWLGNNKGALEALDQYVARESDEGKAAAAWALGEVLRCAQGMEDQADYLDHWFLFQMRDPQPVVDLLGRWESEHRLIGAQVREEDHILTGLVLEQVQSLAPGMAGSRLPHLAAHLLIVANQMRISHPGMQALDKIRQEIQSRVGPAISEPRTGRDAIPFQQVLAEAMVFPLGVENETEARQRVGEHMARFFEEVWVHRPLRSLNQIPPVDAAGHGTLRKKLAGDIQFLQECAEPGLYPYDFDRLRRKLGLLAGAPAAAGEAAGQTTAGPDIPAMSAAELAGLSPESLTDEQAEQAYQAALRLDARDLAGTFAQALVSRPVTPAKPDRFPWYGHLASLAMSEGNTDKALDYLNEGAKADSEHNEGRRQNDYDLRRGQIHAKRGEADAAQTVFDRLIARVPADLRYRGSAAEAMLSAKQGARALAFAEQGLAEARKQNNRDSEDYFKELVAAARKVSG